MRVSALKASGRTRVDVHELSGLATHGQSVSEDGELLAISDELTDVFQIAVGRDGPSGRACAWETGYAAPPDSGSNFEGIAADAHGGIVVVTEFPAGLVMVETTALGEDRFMAHTRLLFDEASMRELAGIDSDDVLQPEGAVLLREGHVLVANEKRPRGLFELGPPGRAPLGVHPGSYLANHEAFAPPAQLVALAWWPVRDHLDDISDLALWNERLFLLSDQSSCIARLAEDHLTPGADVEFDAVWTLPDELGKAEGLIFTEDGQVYVGLDIDLEEQDEENLVRFPALSR